MKLETHNYKEARYPRNVALAHSAPRQQFQGKLTDMCHRCSNCGRGFSSRKVLTTDRTGTHSTCICNILLLSGSRGLACRR